MDITVVWILFGSFLGLLLIGAPITVSLGVAAMGSFIYLGDDPIKLVQIAFRSVGSFPVMALPAFILAGALMEAGLDNGQKFKKMGVDDMFGQTAKPYELVQHYGMTAEHMAEAAIDLLDE